jgi:hypothetical protein
MAYLIIPYFVGFAFLGVFVLLIMLPTNRKVRNAFIWICFGRIQKDYGDLGEASVGGIKQGVRLLKCNRGGDSCFVIESSFISRIQYVKLSEASAKNLVQILSREV